MFGTNGDTNAFLIGLQWAKSKGIECLVKLSRRLIPCYEWKSNLLKLISESNANTYSSYCTKDPFSFRTECVAMHVNTWTKPYPMQCLQFVIQNELPILAEFWFHELAKTIAGNNNSKIWKTYCETNKIGYLHSGYALWPDILGTCRYNSEDRHSDTLWHMYTTSFEYYKKAKEIFGERYSKEMF